MRRTSFGGGAACGVPAGCALAQLSAGAMERASIARRSNEDIIIGGGSVSDGQKIIPMAFYPAGRYRCPTFTRTALVARKSGLLDAVVHNIVLRTTLYYIVLFALARWVYGLPQAEHLINASLDALVNGPVFGMSKKDMAAAAATTPPLSATSLAVTTSASMIGAVLLSLPVAWIYTMTRKRRGYDQSVVQTLILLPALVAGVVVLVKYSLA